MTVTYHLTWCSNPSSTTLTYWTDVKWCNHNHFSSKSSAIFKTSRLVVLSHSDYWLHLDQRGSASVSAAWTNWAPSSNRNIPEILWKRILMRRYCWMLQRNTQNQNQMDNRTPEWWAVRRLQLSSYKLFLFCCLLMSATVRKQLDSLSCACTFRLTLIGCQRSWHHSDSEPNSSATDVSQKLQMESKVFFFCFSDPTFMFSSMKRVLRSSAADGLDAGCFCSILFTQQTDDKLFISV